MAAVGNHVEKRGGTRRNESTPCLQSGSYWPSVAQGIDGAALNAFVHACAGAAKSVWRRRSSAINGRRCLCSKKQQHIFFLFRLWSENARSSQWLPPNRNEAAQKWRLFCSFPILELWGSSLFVRSERSVRNKMRLFLTLFFFSLFHCVEVWKEFEMDFVSGDDRFGLLLSPRSSKKAISELHRAC